MIISTISTGYELEKILAHWGRVDLFQVIVIDEKAIDMALDLLENDVYKLSAETLFLLLKICNLIIMDNGDGNEANIIYQKKYHEYMNELIGKAAKTVNIDLLTIND